MVIPILPLYAKNEFALSETVITLLGTAFFAAQFIAGPILGRWSDRYGRVPILIISQIGTVLSFIMLALAPAAGWLYAARILDGLTGGNIIVAQAYVSDITPKEKQTQNFGLLMGAFGIGFIIGPAVGGVLSAVSGPRIPYLIAAVAATLTVLLSWFTLTETVTDSEKEAAESKQQQPHPFLNFSILKGNVILIPVIGIAFANQFLIGLLQSTMPLYAEARLFAGWTPSNIQLGIGGLFIAVGLGQLFTQVFLLPWLLTFANEVQLVFFALAMRLISMLTFALVPIPIGAVVAGVIFSFGSGTLLPAMQTLATSSVGQTERGEALGVMQAVSSVGIIISSAVAGLIYTLRIDLPFFGGALLAFLAILVALRLRRAVKAQG